MNIKKVKAKSILTKSKLPESDYCINPYVGCAHSCVYCYARFMRRFTGHHESWGEFVDIKINAIEILRQQLASMRMKEGMVLLGSVTDAYQPLERKYELTRGLLKELLNVQFPVSILTKSDLVIRDIDILQQLKCCTVGLTITTLDDKVRARLEPRATSVDRRIEALRQLQKNGISTYAFIGPIFPNLTDLRSIFRSVENIVDAMWGESLNISAGNWSNIEAELREHFPNILPNFKNTVQNSSYWDKTEDEFKSLCSEFKVPIAFFYRH